jgi:hypothetical protein
MREGSVEHGRGPLPRCALWCLSCVLAYTGELEDDLREHIETLRGRVADGC